MPKFCGMGGIVPAAELVDNSTISFHVVLPQVILSDMKQYDNMTDQIQVYELSSQPTKLCFNQI